MRLRLLILLVVSLVFVSFLCFYGLLPVISVDRLADIRYLQWLRRPPAETTCHDWKTGEMTLIPKDGACPCQPANHIYFLKTHKCGSSTFASLLIRFAYKYRLSFGQRSRNDTGNGSLGWPHPILPRHVLPTYVRHLTRNIELEFPGGKINNSLVDIIALHTVYNHSTLNKVMPHDTVKVAIIREPFSQFQSVFDYPDFNFASHFHIKGPNPMKTYLESPTMKEETIYDKHIQNFISTEFGFSNQSENNHVVVKEFISYIDKNFRFVAIMEYFMESILLLKRMLCWRTEDIVFLHLNKNPHKTHQVGPESGENFTYLKILHKRWSAADYLFYDYFNQTFWRKIGREGKEFYDELKDFKDILSQVRRFCQDRPSGPHEDQLIVSKTRWHRAFSVPIKQCEQMHVDIYANVKQFFARDW